VEWRDAYTSVMLASIIPERYVHSLSALVGARRGWRAYFLRYSAKRKAEIKADRPGNGSAQIIMFVSFASPPVAESARQVICISAIELNRRDTSLRVQRIFDIVGVYLVRERTEARDNLSGKLFSRPKLLLLVNDRMGGGKRNVS